VKVGQGISRSPLRPRQRPKGLFLMIGAGFSDFLSPKRSISIWRHRWDEAIGHFTRALHLNKRLEGAYVELGYAYFRKHDYEKEGAAYQEALNLNPDDSDALYSLAWNLESRGRYGEAIPLYEKALKLAPDDTELLYQLGLSYLAQGKRDKATEMCGKLEKFDRGQAGLLRRLIK